MKLLCLLLVCVLGAQAVPVINDQLVKLYAQSHPNNGPVPNPLYGVRLDGDIVLREGVDDQDMAKPNPLNAIWDLKRRWPKEMHYTFDFMFNSDDRQKIEAAIRELVDRTRVDGEVCVDIKPRTGGEQDYVLISQEASYGCGTWFGYSGGEHLLFLDDWCVNSKGVVQHEFLHALGFYHEQSRGDRDDYVYVNYDNIWPGFEGQFDKLEEGVEVDHMGTPYDYGSVLHYDAYAAAVDPSIPTIIPHDPDAVIGNIEKMSDIDIERVQIYHCCLNPADSKHHKHLSMERDYCTDFP